MIKCILAVSLKFTFYEHLKEQNLTRMNFHKKAVWRDWNISKEEFYANLFRDVWEKHFYLPCLIVNMYFSLSVFLKISCSCCIYIT